MFEIAIDIGVSAANPVGPFRQFTLGILALTKPHVHERAGHLSRGLLIGIFRFDYAKRAAMPAKKLEYVIVNPRLVPELERQFASPRELCCKLFQHRNIFLE